MLFLSGWDSGLVSLRWVRYRLVWLFSIPVFSACDQRDKSGSRSHRLGIGIRADNRRVVIGRPLRKSRLGFGFGVRLCRRLSGRFCFGLGSRLPFGFRWSLGLGWGRL